LRQNLGACHSERSEESRSESGSATWEIPPSLRSGPPSAPPNDRCAAFLAQTMVTPRQNIVTLARAVVFTIAVAAIFACPALAWRAGPPQNPPITGVVRDQTGAAIAGAEVRFRSGSFTASETTDDQGRFSFELPPAQTRSITAGPVTVTAPGFADAERTWNAREADSGHLEI